VRRRKSCTRAAAALVEHAVERRGGKRSWSSGCSTSSHFAGGGLPACRASARARLSVSGLVNTLSAETSQSQIKIAGAGQRQCAAFDVRDDAGGGAAAGEGVLHDGKTRISITISTRPPSSAGPTMVVW